MPPLNEMLKTEMPGFTPVPAAPLPPPTSTFGLGSNFKYNPAIRCPIPPTSAGPDTLRQFDEGNSNIPRRRVLPLPQTNGGSGTTVNNNTTVVSSGGGGSSNTGLSAKVVVIAAGTLAVGAALRRTVAITARSYQLISCVASNACEMRIYGNSSSMAMDASRATDAPLAAELGNGLVTDIVFDTSSFTWTWQNRVGCNSDSPQTDNIYVALINTGLVPANITVTLTYLPLEP